VVGGEKVTQTTPFQMELEFKREQAEESRRRFERLMELYFGEGGVGGRSPLLRSQKESVLKKGRERRQAIPSEFQARGAFRSGLVGTAQRKNIVDTRERIGQLEAGEAQKRQDMLLGLLKQFFGGSI
jgi:hypothetical protein